MIHLLVAIHASNQLSGSRDSLITRKNYAKSPLMELPICL